MKTFLVLWLAPMGFFWTWYLLSANDISFGLFFFSRSLHDLVFQIYGEMLGIDPASIPPMLMRALAFDTAIVLSIIAFRKRRWIVSFVRAKRASYLGARLARTESLSSAP